MDQRHIFAASYRRTPEQHVSWSHSHLFHHRIVRMTNIQTWCKCSHRLTTIQCSNHVQARKTITKSHIHFLSAEMRKQLLHKERYMKWKRGREGEEHKGGRTTVPCCPPTRSHSNLPLAIVFVLTMKRHPIDFPLIYQSNNHFSKWAFVFFSFYLLVAIPEPICSSKRYVKPFNRYSSENFRSIFANGWIVPFRFVFLHSIRCVRMRGRLSLV